MVNVSSSNGIEKCPKLRFPEFTKPWGSVQLGALFKKNTQKNSAGVVTNVICNSAKNGLIPQKDYFDKDIANADNTAGYYIISKNDFVYNPRKSADAPYGPISRYTYEEDGIVSPLYLCFCGSKEVNPEYFERYFRSSAWHRYIYMSGDSGARHDRVSIKDDTFFEMPIYLPCNHEQKKIADFLSLLEKKIEYQTALIDNLKKYKRGLAKRLFEEITLMHPSVEIESLFSFIRNGFVGTVTPYFTDKNKGVRYLQGTNVHSGKITDDTEFYISKEFNEKHQKNILKPDDILVVQSGHVGECAVVGDKYAGANCHALIIMSNAGSCCSKYVAQYINSDIGIQKIAAITTGNTIKHILATTIAKVTVPVPSLDEQKRIANVLEKTDKHIDLEEQFLMHLISMRQGFLQQLFI